MLEPFAPCGAKQPMNFRKQRASSETQVHFLRKFRKQRAYFLRKRKLRKMNEQDQLDDPYDVLHIFTPDANEREIRAAYRRLCLYLHPDEGGTKEEFQQLAAAYELIGDPEKRKLFDRYGHRVNQMVQERAAQKQSRRNMERDFRDLFKKGRRGRKGRGDAGKSTRWGDEFHFDFDDDDGLFSEDGSDCDYDSDYTSEDDFGSSDVEEEQGHGSYGNGAGAAGGRYGGVFASRLLEMLLEELLNGRRQRAAAGRRNINKSSQQEERSRYFDYSAVGGSADRDHLRGTFFDFEKDDDAYFSTLHQMLEERRQQADELKKRTQEQKAKRRAEHSLRVAEQPLKNYQKYVKKNLKKIVGKVVQTKFEETSFFIYTRKEFKEHQEFAEKKNAVFLKKNNVAKNGAAGGNRPPTLLPRLDPEEQVQQDHLYAKMLSDPAARFLAREVVVTFVDPAQEESLLKWADHLADDKNQLERCAEAITSLQKACDDWEDKRKKLTTWRSEQAVLLDDVDVLEEHEEDNDRGAPASFFRESETSTSGGGFSSAGAADCPLKKKAGGRPPTAFEELKKSFPECRPLLSPLEALQKIVYGPPAAPKGGVRSVTSYMVKIEGQVFDPDPAAAEAIENAQGAEAASQEAQEELVSGVAAKKPKKKSSKQANLALTKPSVSSAGGAARAQAASPSSSTSDGAGSEGYWHRYSLEEDALVLAERMGIFGKYDCKRLTEIFKEAPLAMQDGGELLQWALNKLEYEEKCESKKEEPAKGTGRGQQKSKSEMKKSGGRVKHELQDVNKVGTLGLGGATTGPGPQSHGSTPRTVMEAREGDLLPVATRKLIREICDAIFGDHEAEREKRTREVELLVTRVQGLRARYQMSWGRCCTLLGEHQDFKWKNNTIVVEMMADVEQKWGVSDYRDDLAGFVAFTDNVLFKHIYDGTDAWNWGDIYRPLRNYLRRKVGRATLLRSIYASYPAAFFALVIRDVDPGLARRIEGIDEALQNAPAPVSDSSCTFSTGALVEAGRPPGEGPAEQMEAADADGDLPEDDPCCFEVLQSHLVETAREICRRWEMCRPGGPTEKVFQMLQLDGTSDDIPAVVEAWLWKCSESEESWRIETVLDFVDTGDFHEQGEISDLTFWEMLLPGERSREGFVVRQLASTMLVTYIIRFMKQHGEKRKLAILRDELRQQMAVRATLFWENAGATLFWENSPDTGCIVTLAEENLFALLPCLGL